LNLLVDFANKTLKGYVELSLKTKEDISEVILDFVGLKVKKVFLIKGKEHLKKKIKRRQL